ncbi:MAG: cyclic nucleotide-binding domain-containing protein [Bacteriovoracaceae bacterium]|nr:cyclic nucleotide-binding domain-containing protein [Bacteriovoracaceae bacterium]
MSVQEFESIFSVSIQNLFFSNEAPLYYKGQYLSGLFFIKKGKIHLLNSGQSSVVLEENQILGLKPSSLLTVSNENAIVEGNTEILFVSKSDVLKNRKFLKKYFQ